MSERDKFLTEAMGECSHGNVTHYRSFDDWMDYFCRDCNQNLGQAEWDNGVVVPYKRDKSTADDFSTWQGFGKLWEWAQEREWLNQLSWECGNGYGTARYGHLQFHVDYINPDRFANAVYEFLKENS